MARALEETSVELNDQLLSLPDFNCAMCKNILIAPIVLVANIGNVCGSCKKKIDPSDPFIANPALENILRHLKLHCKYHDNGCKEKIDYQNIEMHELKCIYRDCTCPMSYFNNCDWHGHATLLGEHFDDCHPNNIKRQSANSSIYVQIDISKSAHSIMLLLTKNDKFLLNVMCDLASNKLWYSMYYIGNAEKSSDFHYNIEQIGQENRSIKFESKLAVLPDSEFTKETNINSALSFDLSFLKQIIQEDQHFISVIQILSSNSESGVLDEKLLNFLECPICSNFMKPPILQCLSGHSICSTCRPKLGQCPTCRSSFGNTRNYSLEAVSSGVRYPCVYRDFGCVVTMPPTQIIQHEGECPVRPYTCPLKDVLLCHWEGTHSNISTHLKACHSEKVKFTNHLKTTLVFSFDHVQYDVYCLVTYGEVFRVWFRHDVGDQNGYWAVQLVGSKNEAKNYKFEIGLIDSRNEHRTLVRSDLCIDVTSQFNIFNNCSVPVNVISGFSVNGQMKYFCKIIKLNK